VGSLRDLGSNRTSSTMGQDEKEHPDTTTLNVAEKIVQDFYNRLPDRVVFNGEFGASAFQLIETLLSIFKARR